MEATCLGWHEQGGECYKVKNDQEEQGLDCGVLVGRFILDEDFGFDPKEAESHWSVLIREARSDLFLEGPQ